MFVAYICWFIWEHTHAALWPRFFDFVETNVSSWVLLLTRGAQTGT